MRSWACSLCLVAPLALAGAQDQPQPSGWGVAPADVPPAQANPLIDAEQAAVPSFDPKGALSAMMAVGPQYSQGIVVVTGRDGSPQPREWSVVARDSNDMGTLHTLTVVDGAVVGSPISLNAYEAMRQKISIDLSQVQVDSGQAFAIAVPIVAANQKILGHCDYALTMRSRDSTPIWTVNCFDTNGVYIGKVIMLATTGAIVETPGFPNAPAVQ